jgi:hypothetical protein
LKKIAIEREWGLDFRDMIKFGGTKMGKYKDIDKTTPLEAIIPPSTVTIKRIDEETDESATGTGYTYDQAREKAQEKLDKEKKK